MPYNLDDTKLAVLSAKTHDEWMRNTVLVNSCDRSFEGEFDIDQRKINIRVYHDIKVYSSSVAEMELEPQPIQFLKGTLKTIEVSKVRYAHWGQTNISELLTDDEQGQKAREKVVNRMSQSAEYELALHCATLPTDQTIDITKIFKPDIEANGLVNSDNILKVIEILKAKIRQHHHNIEDFTFFASERFESLLTESKLVIVKDKETFEKGEIGLVSGLHIKRLEVEGLTTRDNKTGLVNAEWGILKANDGINYVVPYKNTIQYDLQPSEVLLGGKGYQQVELYDFVNLYPTRLFKVNLTYKQSATAPVITAQDVLNKSFDK